MPGERDHSLGMYGRFCVAFHVALPKCLREAIHGMKTLFWHMVPNVLSPV